MLLKEVSATKHMKKDLFSEIMFSNYNYYCCILSPEAEFMNTNLRKISRFLPSAIHKRIFSTLL